MSYIRFIFGKG